MTCRVDTSLIAGACVVGDRGLGVLGSVIRATTGPSSGPHGAGYLYNDWQDSSDDGKEFRGLIVTPPSAGTFSAYEDGSFSLVGAPDGSYSFVYRLYVDGADLGTATASITVTAEPVAALTTTVAGSASFIITATAAVNASIITPVPASEPVTVDEAKQAARISDTAAFDAQIPMLISAARRMAEQETGRTLVRTTTSYRFASWPSAACPLPVHDAAAVVVSYWGAAGWETLPSESVAFFEIGAATGIAPALGTSWPALASVAGGPRVRVDITAGPADPTTADPCVKLYIKALVAWWIDNPSAMAAGNLQEAPFLRSLLDPVRLWS